MNVKIYDKIEDKDSKFNISNFMHKIKSNLSWEDGLFCFILLAAFFINFGMLSQLNQLPSPLYGGDYYNHLGSIEHLYQGGSVFTSGQMIGEIQWVPWLYHVIVVLFAKVTTLSPMFAIIYFSLIALLLGCTIIYLFVSKFFQSKLLGLLAVLWHVSFFPIFKYTIFAFYVILPLFLFAAYLFLKKPDYKSAIILGICYGLAGLSTTYVFIEGTFFLGFLLCYTILFENIKIHENWKIDINKKEFMHSFILGAIAFTIGFAISLLWWYNPIFVHHAKTANDMQIYGFPEIKGFGGMLKLVGDGFKNEFTINKYMFTSNLGFAFKRILMVLGIASLFLLRKRSKEQTFLKILLFASLFGLFIHFLTVPLLGTLMASTGLFQVGMMYSAVLLALLAVEIMLHYSSHAGKYKDYIFILILVIIAVGSIVGYTQQMKANQADQWWKLGTTPLPPSHQETRTWVLDNTNLDDVFITTNEDGFALNALTGRKVVTYRRTHASPYADLNERMLETGVMLYGSNNELREALFEKYSVDYLYWNQRWILNEFQIGQDGRIAGIFDPLSADYSPEREALMRSANVTFARQSWYLDPAWLPSYPKRDLIVLLPARSEIERPWDETLDPYLELQKEIYENGQVVTRIYKVNRKPVVAIPNFETNQTTN